jgi:hypothetical protein
MNNDSNNSNLHNDLDLPDKNSVEIINKIESYIKNEQNFQKQTKETKKPTLNNSNTEKVFFVYGKNSKQNNISKEKRLLSASQKAQNLTSYDNKLSNQITKTFDNPIENRYSITYVNFENRFAEIKSNKNNKNFKEKNKSKKNSFLKKLILQDSKNNYENASNNNINKTYGNNKVYNGTCEQTTFNNVYAVNITGNNLNNILNTNLNNDTKTNATNEIVNINSNNLNARKEKNFEKAEIFATRTKEKGYDFIGSTKENGEKPKILFNSSNFNINRVNINLKISENKAINSKGDNNIKIKNSNFENKNHENGYKNYANNNYNTGERTQSNFGCGTFSSTYGLNKIKSKDFRFRETNKTQEKLGNVNKFICTIGFEINKFRKENKTHCDNFITINHCNNG